MNCLSLLLSLNPLNFLKTFQTSLYIFHLSHAACIRWSRAFQRHLQAIIRHFSRFRRCLFRVILVPPARASIKPSLLLSCPLSFHHTHLPQDLSSFPIISMHFRFALLATTAAAFVSASPIERSLEERAGPSGQLVQPSGMRCVRSLVDKLT